MCLKIKAITDKDPTNSAEKTDDTPRIYALQKYDNEQYSLRVLVGLCTWLTSVQAYSIKSASLGYGMQRSPEGTKSE